MSADPAAHSVPLGARGTWLLATSLGISLLALAAALVSQHRFDMQPCPWCVLQRLIFVCIALTALPGLLWRGWALQRALAVLMLLLAASGAAAALWQQLVAASSTSCTLTLADRIVGGLGLDGWWPEVFAAYATCAEASVKLAGVPYAMWSLAVFGLLGAVALRLCLAPAPTRSNPLPGAR
jgi:protein dithiol:quinone oxidoreductase